MYLHFFSPFAGFLGEQHNIDLVLADSRANGMSSEGSTAENGKLKRTQGPGFERE